MLPSSSPPASASSPSWSSARCPRAPSMPARLRPSERPRRRATAVARRRARRVPGRPRAPARSARRRGAARRPTPTGSGSSAQEGRAHEPARRPRTRLKIGARRRPAVPLATSSTPTSSRTCRGGSVQLAPRPPRPRPATIGCQARVVSITSGVHGPAATSTAPAGRLTPAASTPRTRPPSRPRARPARPRGARGGAAARAGEARWPSPDAPGSRSSTRGSWQAADARRARARRGGRGPGSVGSSSGASQAISAHAGSSARCDSPASICPPAGSLGHFEAGSRGSGRRAAPSLEPRRSTGSKGVVTPSPRSQAPTAGRPVTSSRSHERDAARPPRPGTRCRAPTTAAAEIATSGRSAQLPAA